MNNIDSDQPTHLPRLISAFVICFLKSIMTRLDTRKIVKFWLNSVADKCNNWNLFANPENKIHKINEAADMFDENKECACLPKQK